MTLFPDVKAYGDWSRIASEMGFSISDLLEKNATDTQREAGVDLADFLIRDDFKTYINVLEKTRDPVPIEQAPANPLKARSDIRSAPPSTPPLYTSRHSVTFTKSKQLTQPDQETTDLISFFENLTIPVEAIRLNDHTTITDPGKFIRSHIDTVKSNAHNPLYGVYKERLRQMRDLKARLG